VQIQNEKEMGRQRDNKGRFVKGVEIGRENLKPFTKDNASEMGQRSGEAKRRRKLLRETLIEELEKETAKGSGLSKQEAIVAAVVKNVYDKPSAKALKILTEILGEMEINVNLNQSEKPKIVFDDGE
jgi:hypothetical protein